MTTLPTVRFGVIGLGAIGQRLLRALTAHPHVRVTAVNDLNAQVLRETAESTGATPFDDYHALLHSDLVDAVYVAVPPAAHHEIVLAAAQAGKHILCEKPLSLTLPQARDMLHAVKRAGVVHAMQLPMHHSGGVHAFTTRLAQGDIGPVRRVELTLVFPEWPRAWQQNAWIGGREQGGPVRECTPHLFEVIERALGPVRRVWADVVYPPDGVSSEESASGVLELEGGARVNVSVLCHVPQPETVSLTVYGAAGTLGLRNWAQPVFSGDATPLQPLPVPAVDGTLIDHFVRAVHGEPADLPGLDVGLRLQALQQAWEDAAASGAWVDVRAE